MLNKTKRDQIISLINREVVPALGCTEPVAVALCVAKARELLGEMPEKIRLSLSGNIIKNAMGVGIPGTGMIGLPIAVALGALIGKSDLGLEVLQEVNEGAVEKAKVSWIKIASKSSTRKRFLLIFISTPSFLMELKQHVQLLQETIHTLSF